MVAFGTVMTLGAVIHIYLSRAQNIGLKRFPEQKNGILIILTN